jgi:hypothetical protein
MRTTTLKAVGLFVCVVMGFLEEDDSQAITGSFSENLTNKIQAHILALSDLLSPALIAKVSQNNDQQVALKVAADPGVVVAIAH